MCRVVTVAVTSCISTEQELFVLFIAVGSVSPYKR